MRDAAICSAVAVDHGNGGIYLSTRARTTASIVIYGRALFASGERGKVARARVEINLPPAASARSPDNLLGGGGDYAYCVPRIWRHARDRQKADRSWKGFSQAFEPRGFSLNVMRGCVLCVIIRQMEFQRRVGASTRTPGGTGVQSDE